MHSILRGTRRLQVIGAVVAGLLVAWPASSQPANQRPSAGRIVGKGIVVGLALAFIGIVPDRLISAWSSRIRERFDLPA